MKYNALSTYRSIAIAVQLNHIRKQREYQSRAISAYTYPSLFDTRVFVFWKVFYPPRLSYRLHIGHTCPANESRETQWRKAIKHLYPVAIFAHIYNRDETEMRNEGRLTHALLETRCTTCCDLHIQIFLIFSKMLLCTSFPIRIQFSKLRGSVELIRDKSFTTYLRELPRPSQKKARTGRKETRWLPLQYTTNATANIEIEILRSMFFSEGVLHFDDRDIFAHRRVLYRTCCLRKCESASYFSPLV